MDARSRASATLELPSLGGANPGSFSFLSNSCSGNVLSPGEICQLEVTLVVGADGVYSAIASLSDGVTPSNASALIGRASGFDPCRARPDYAPCTVVTVPDRDYDVCAGEACVSPGCGTSSCNVPGPSFPLADTSQRSCYDTSASIVCPSLSGCTDGQFCGQDAQYGWDASHESPQRFGRTTPLADNPVVEDRVTGLMWQGCNAGLVGDSCTTASGTTAFDLETAFAFCDDLSWGGFADWRLPDVFALQSISDLGRTGPSLDPGIFPNALRYTWTSTISAARGGASPWAVDVYFWGTDGSVQG